MSAVEILRARGPMEARHIASIVGCSIESMYEQLVAAEARGLVQVIVHRTLGCQYREWEAV